MSLGWDEQVPWPRAESPRGAAWLSLPSLMKANSVGKRSLLPASSLVSRVLHSETHQDSGCSEDSQPSSSGEFLTRSPRALLVLATTGASKQAHCNYHLVPLCPCLALAAPNKPCRCPGLQQTGLCGQEPPVRSGCDPGREPPAVPGLAPCPRLAARLSPFPSPRRRSSNEVLAVGMIKRICA